MSAQRNYLPGTLLLLRLVFLLFSRAHRIYCYDYYEICLRRVHSETNSERITLPVHIVHMAHLRIKSVGTTTEEEERKIAQNVNDGTRYTHAHRKVSLWAPRSCCLCGTYTHTRRHFDQTEYLAFEKNENRRVEQKCRARAEWKRQRRFALNMANHYVCMREGLSISQIRNALILNM